MMRSGFVELDFALYFEPEDGINNPREFTAELLRWAEKEHRDLVILEESMEPVVKLDGAEYLCRLADPQVAEQNNPIWKQLCKHGITRSVGPFLGYKWVYLYQRNC